MEGRLIVFLVLSLLILTLYPYLLELAGVKPPEPTRTPTPAVTAREAEAPSVPAREGGIIPVPEPPVAGTERPGQEIIIDTPLYRATLSTRGGVIRRWELKRYTTHYGKDAPNVQLVADGIKGPVVWPLSIASDDPAVSRVFQEGLYTANTTGPVEISEKDAKATILLSSSDPATGRRVTKRLIFYSDSYHVDGTVWADGFDRGYTLLLGSNFGIHDWGGKGVTGHIGPISLIDNVIVKDKPAKMAGTVLHEGTLSWTALEDKYFLAALIPRDGKPKVVVDKKTDQDLTVGLHITAAAGSQQAAQTFTLYAGPKELDRLKAFDVSLDETIDFGWFMFGSWTLVRIIAKPLFLVLRSLHGLTYNYGLAIILLTMGIKILFIPLTHKSYRSMKKMQVLQPKVKELQKKYENDRERLNKELMGLYQSEKVNPLGGCLPMLLQIPVFVALFNILYATIELRQAPFYAWIHDLSTPDPIYVLPIIMGATMFIQQRIQPAAMDPRQAKLMMFLPIVFTFFFLNFPAGLVLYWLVNNVLTIAQQLVTVRFFQPATSTA